MSYFHMRWSFHACSTPRREAGGGGRPTRRFVAEAPCWRLHARFRPVAPCWRNQVADYEDEATRWSRRCSRARCMGLGRGLRRAGGAGAAHGRLVVRPRHMYAPTSTCMQQVHARQWACMCVCSGMRGVARVRVARWRISIGRRSWLRWDWRRSECNSHEIPPLGGRRPPCNSPVIAPN